MAILQGTETVAVTTQERSWRINIETPLAADPVVTIFRETVRTAGGAVLSRVPAGQVERRLSNVAGEVQDFTPSQPGKITAAELAGLIAARADQWRAADLATAAAG